MNRLLDIDDSKVSEILSKNINQVIALFFWAPWDKVSSDLRTQIKHMADKHSDKVIYAAINVDQNPHSPVNYNVRAIPHLSLFSKGHIISYLEGPHEAQRFYELIHKYSEDNAS